MKIKLIIIDTFDYSYQPAQPEYYFTGDHIDNFCYSPSSSEKIIETDPSSSEKIIETDFTPQPVLLNA